MIEEKGMKKIGEGDYGRVMEGLKFISNLSWMGGRREEEKRIYTGIYTWIGRELGGEVEREF